MVNTSIRQSNPLDRASPGSTAPTGTQAKPARLSRVVILFLVSLVIPVTFSLGPLLLSPVRIVLLLMFGPLLLLWVMGKCGRIRVTDVFMLLFCLWLAIALVANHGGTIVQFAGITFVEAFCPYLLARYYIRSERDFRQFALVLFFLMLFLIPGAMSEALAGKRLYDPLFSAFGNTFYWRLDPRWGMFRAQVSFEHPILYGVFCSTAFSLLFFAPRRRSTGFAGPRLAWAPFVATFFSLSAGALLGLVIQSGLILWNWVLKLVSWRWYLLSGLVILAYIVIDIFSNRTPFEVFISYLTFNSETSYWRVLIFKYSIDDVLGSPIFGIGLDDWTRPRWMHSSSVDNFWLLNALRYGIPGFLFILATYIAAILALVRAKPSSPIASNQRMALTFVLVAVGVSMATVHLWGATFVYFCFLLGAGAWLSEAAESDDTASAIAGDGTPADDDGAFKWTRAANKHVRQRRSGRAD